MALKNFQSVEEVKELLKMNFDGLNTVLLLGGGLVRASHHLSMASEDHNHVFDYSEVDDSETKYSWIEFGERYNRFIDNKSFALEVVTPEELKQSEIRLRMMVAEDRGREKRNTKRRQKAKK